MEGKKVIRIVNNKPRAFSFSFTEGADGATIGSGKQGAAFGTTVPLHQTT